MLHIVLSTAVMFSIIIDLQFYVRYELSLLPLVISSFTNIAIGIIMAITFEFVLVASGNFGPTAHRKFLPQ